MTKESFIYIKIKDFCSLKSTQNLHPSAILSYLQLPRVVHRKGNQKVWSVYEEIPQITGGQMNVHENTEPLYNHQTGKN